ncbi:putative kinetochore protein NUF2 [Astathelohania contejeani]|uniref:Kinetochore protein NUF2 n=1 Tax=Astathelohania contejeani TaxID=164912 RepID=A0ABQ7I2P5_9MICR|nr:putative kinetochore protein NUF2 [Thelohania contejeani]
MPANLQNYSTKEIIDYFADFQIQIKPLDLQKPTPASTTKLFESLLDLYKGVKTSAIMARINSSSLDSTYEEALYLITLSKRVNQFIKSIGGVGRKMSFTLRDLAQPDPKRISVFLSAIVGFSMFRDSKCEVYERLSRRAQEAEGLGMDISNEIAAKEEQIRIAEEELSQRKKLQDAISSEIQFIESTLRESYKTHRAKIKSLEGIKKEKNILIDKQSSMQLMVLNLKGEIACLKTQIVSDPTKLMDLLEEMKSMVSKEKESIALLKQRSEELSNLNLEYNLEELKVCAKKCALIKAEHKKIGVLLREMSNVENVINESNNEILVYQKKINHVYRQISHLESKIHNLQENDKQCTTMITDQLGVLKSNYEKMSEAKLSIREKIEENMKKTREIENEILKAKTTHDNECVEIQYLLCNLKDHILSYCSETRNVINNE